MDPIFYHQYTPVRLAYIPAPWIRHGNVIMAGLPAISTGRMPLMCAARAGHLKVRRSDVQQPKLGGLKKQHIFLTWNLRFDMV
jgi:hypothetical protein